ncbi:MAG TPA: carboxypeptidase regulatory-like domain-containing protein [Vicinamibacterales bacterium]|nr:carboxypeptidase regulatory-like domain-containing protein [Vicinamibacterales bacterium]
MLIVAIFAAGCGGSTSKSPAAAPPAVDPATAASLTGQIALDGTPPPPEVIRMEGDPKCVAAAQDEERRSEYVVSKDGKSLQNVFVYIKEGLPQRLYPVPNEPVVLDQQKCRYVPHVLGVQVGQALEVRNSDPLLHNVHAEGAVNRAFDVGQPLPGIKTTHTFTTREVMIPVKCQVHSWMHGYIGVLEHPFFAVSDANGHFAIPQLPPGTYTVEAWHERLGTQTQQIIVAPKEAKTLNFTFKVS